MKSFRWCFDSVFLVILNEISLFAVLCFVTEPQLRDISNGHNIIGDDVTLECTVGSNKPQVVIKWMVPLNLNLTVDRINISTTTQNFSLTFYVTKSFYTISKFKFSDQNIYYCAATEVDNPFDRKYRYLWVPVYDPGENLIEFYKNLTVVDKSNAEVEVHVRAHPEPIFNWFDNNNNTISLTSTKFSIEKKRSNDFTNYISVLKFYKISQEDFGNYTLSAKNNYETKNFTVYINITGPPSTNVKVVSNDEDFSVIRGQALSYPKPNITWQFEKCENLSCFGHEYQPNEANISRKEEFRNEDNGLQSVSYVAMNKQTSGLLRGIGTNSLGQNSSLQQIYRVKNGFEIFSTNLVKNGTVLKIEALFKENIEIICAVSLDDYYHEIKWWKDSRNYSLEDIRVPIKGFDEYHIKNIDAVFSSISVLKLNIDKTDQDNHTCKASRKNGTIESRVITIIAREQPSLNVASNMQNKTVIVRFGSSWKFYCNIDGYPTPHIKWYKNDTIIKSNDKMDIRDNNQTLAIYDIGPSDNGTYKCIVSNRLNNTIIKLAFLGAIPSGFDWLLLVIILLICILFFVTIFIIIKIRKERKLKEELKSVGLANFEEGDIECLNPDLRLDDQVDLLPYDKKWEIPSKNLTLGKELGSGNFGVVVKGELKGIPNENSNTTVAVKMVNKFADNDLIRALASELKIMVHLGQHVNIVNLIGACTQDIMKKKLLVVVEFCACGNLQDYVLTNSNNFVDQRRKSTDDFDWNIKPNDFKEISSIKSLKNAPKLQYSTLSFSSVDSSESSECDKPYTDKCNSSETDKYMCSQDFLIWSFQIAKGMEYLASRRVLHGDLAARNVLLAENNVVKISDFGLSRSMYKNGIYKKKANGPLPVKWMAIESIAQQVFSTQSDVWSFGITLWELFSIAKTPYPGMQVDQVFFNKLMGGYRMEKPEFATTKIYNIMLDCWNATPMNRPTFTELAERIGFLLEEPVKNHYLDMNSPYVLMNNQGVSSSQEDYLMMMSKPDFEQVVPPGPNYVNNITYFQNAGINMGYVTDKTENVD